jgi:hypothetical protein
VPSVDSITDELQNLMAGAGAFRPTALELVRYFLRPMIAGQPLPRAARFIHDADVYAAAPDHLAATHAPAPPDPAAAGGRANKLVWYFFSPLHYQMRYRKTTPCRRVGGSGTWKGAVNRGRLAEEGEAANWYEMSLIYYELRHGASSESRNKTSSPTEWRMREYGIAQGGGGGLLHPLVLCEVFRSPLG